MDCSDAIESVQQQTLYLIRSSRKFDHWSKGIKMEDNIFFLSSHQTPLTSVSSPYKLRTTELHISNILSIKHKDGVEGLTEKKKRRPLKVSKQFLRRKRGLSSYNYISFSSRVLFQATKTKPVAIYDTYDYLLESFPRRH